MVRAEVWELHMMVALGGRVWWKREKPGCEERERTPKNLATR
jgi:hypothetical protein